MRTRHAANASGDWYIDTECINCKAAQTVAPGLIVERDGQSVFDHQPATEEERILAWRARLLCPTASVHAEHAAAPQAAVFPEAMTERVWRLGYNARHSWGAHSFLVERSSGNAMIDAPRWTDHVAHAIEERGGLALVLLTHRDDVADAERYAQHFRARVFIHEDDRGAAPYATDLLRGRAPTALGDDLLAIPVPGHTKGSAASSPAIHSPGISPPAISGHRNMSAGIRGPSRRSRCTRSPSITSNGYSPGMAGASVSRPTRCVRGCWP